MAEGHKEWWGQGVVAVGCVQWIAMASAETGGDGCSVTSVG